MSENKRVIEHTHKLDIKLRWSRFVGQVGDMFKGYKS